ncbi:protein-L-isoaspartate(D-aspartate) O-methyltransferase [Anaeromyxobacter oryzae]|uniref:Protein-L-isoaspartate O-methyltransferase n=1 Tax=Anaeromyxobacter oryzae TaxID=2918170 RepID=A0ABM7X476_9BACT|nr:protein-L-isoaspartate(D-aspartate) O-methyltransferase [Anaeromyxobacter oryzae]BDG06600.1 protein-L-isoaspartate O-methyltransferase [Anaeromyxobacter oryzae]
MSVALARRLAGQGIRDPRVLEAIARLDRGRFVPEAHRAEADLDQPLPIGFGQTISQPFVVAFMTERLELSGDERVLEIGTGSGYQTAVLAALARHVFSVEIVAPLAERAREVLLGELALPNVSLRTGDGALGWPDAAPFDRIVVTAATPRIPDALIAQLAPGGLLILPLGEPHGDQALRVIRRERTGALGSEDVLPVRFVPLTHGVAPKDGAP